MNILVTGCAGFIGWKVCESLLKEGHTVLGVDNLNDAYDVRLKEWRLGQVSNNPDFEFRKLDITDRAALAGILSNRPNRHNKRNRRDDTTDAIDAVINLAARAGVRQSVQSPKAFYETNVDGTLNLLELCSEHGVKKFVLASTSSLYGAHNAMPFKEDADTSRPLSPYAASKKAAETLCYTYHYLYGLDVT
jgi:nucleoside-diphosphate-sugar epimerase